MKEADLFAEQAAWLRHQLPQVQEDDLPLLTLVSLGWEGTTLAFAQQIDCPHALALRSAHHLAALDLIVAQEDVGRSGRLAITMGERLRLLLEGAEDS
ncbi:hypothetical protein [Polycladidibacter hongkongensis]|uniref:hypothetical protein n=1 Tax=Polycladidibacter hongkongensis TaxID=1647556 RepID=UPI00082C008A|nr:hypothetical protein [Pseudovibrio hongkongensis]